MALMMVPTSYWALASLIESSLFESSLIEYIFCNLAIYQIDKICIDIIEVS
jgi:hypothetical protein